MDIQALTYCIQIIAYWSTGFEPSTQETSQIIEYWSWASGKPCQVSSYESIWRASSSTSTAHLNTTVLAPDIRLKLWFAVCWTLHFSQMSVPCHLTWGDMRDDCILYLVALITRADLYALVSGDDPKSLVI